MTSINLYTSIIVYNSGSQIGGRDP